MERPNPQCYSVALIGIRGLATDAPLFVHPAPFTLTPFQVHESATLKEEVKYILQTVDTLEECPEVKVLKGGTRLDIRIDPFTVRIIRTNTGRYATLLIPDTPIQHHKVQDAFQRDAPQNSLPCSACLGLCGSDLNLSGLDSTCPRVLSSTLRAMHDSFCGGLKGPCVVGVDMLPALLKLGPLILKHPRTMLAAQVSAVANQIVESAHAHRAIDWGWKLVIQSSGLESILTKRLAPALKLSL